ncbi:MAG: carbon storage regulator CsrA [Alphaproteobacteria bacterium]|nr:carbon storage regulator CsrA [Alphaproteobacteria bacterium]
MLHLTRKVGDAIVINEEITITVTEIRGKTVRLTFSAPDGTRILRKELYEKIQTQNQAAADTIDLIKKVLK